MAIEISGKREKKIFAMGNRQGSLKARAKVAASQMKEDAIGIAGADIGQRFLKDSKIPKMKNTPTQYGAAIAAVGLPYVGVKVPRDIQRFCVGMAQGQRAVDVYKSATSKNVLPW